MEVQKQKVPRTIVYGDVVTESEISESLEEAEAEQSPDESINTPPQDKKENDA